MLTSVHADNIDFNVLGLSIDDLIASYIQTVLSVTAIDRMCQRLVRKDGGAVGSGVKRSMYGWMEL